MSLFAKAWETVMYLAYKAVLTCLLCWVLGRQEGDSEKYLNNDILGDCDAYDSDIRFCGLL